MAIAAVVAGGLAIAGAVAGAQEDVVKETSTSETEVFLPPESNEERVARENASFAIQDFRDLITGPGTPGKQDVVAGADAQRELGSLLQEITNQRGLPTGEDVAQSRQISENLFRPEQVQLRQFFEDQGVEADREAARLGRPTTDPILRAKLASQRGRALERVQARQTASTQQIALQAPERRAQFASARANVLGGLASQALKNKQNLFSISSQFAAQEFSRRAAQSRTVTSGTGTQTSGGGFKGAVEGGIAGFSAGAGAFGGGAGGAGAGGGGGGGAPRSSV